MFHPLATSSFASACRNGKVPPLQVSFNRSSLPRLRLWLWLTAWLCTQWLHTAEDIRARSTNLPSGVRPIKAHDLHNVFALTTNILSGSSPEGTNGFASLAKLGVKTIISVDGARPDVETARAHGIRYVHLPHGYAGIPTNLQLQLAKAAATLDGPIYVHCHHGQHRGPAAAAIMCMANEGWSPGQGEAWLVTAGTATNYAGLYAAVRSFATPTAAQWTATVANFPETAKVSGLVDVMVEIDEHWEQLKAARAAGYATPREHPDVKPANAMVILWEHYREAQRLPDAAHHGTRFIEWLKSAEDEARDAERLLRSFASDRNPAARSQLDRTFEAIGNQCASCHKHYRDTKP
jgi:hypothetical protein